MSHDLNKKCGVCVTVADIEYLNEILSHRLSILYHFENSIWPYIVKILYKLFYTISIYKHFKMGMTYFSLVHCLNYLHSYKKMACGRIFHNLINFVWSTLELNSTILKDFRYHKNDLYFYNWYKKMFLVKNRGRDTDLNEVWIGSPFSQKS